MAKNLKEFIQCGRDPAYLKNGDTITEELARELICAEMKMDAWMGNLKSRRAGSSRTSSEARASTRQSGEKVRTIRGHTSDCARQEWIRTSRRSTPR